MAHLRRFALLVFLFNIVMALHAQDDDTVLFFDDFEDGDLQGWDLTYALDAVEVIEIDGNSVLHVTGEQTDFASLGFDSFQGEGVILEARVYFLNSTRGEPMDFNVASEMPGHGSGYSALIDPFANNVFLAERDNGFRGLDTGGQMPNFSRETWHLMRFQIIDDHLTLFFDGELFLHTTVTSDLQGEPLFIFSVGNELYLDDVKVLNAAGAQEIETQDTTAPETRTVVCGENTDNAVTTGAQLIYGSIDGRALCSMNLDGTAPRTLIETIPIEGAEYAFIRALDIAENGSALFVLVEHVIVDEAARTSDVLGYDGYTIDLVNGEVFSLEDMLIGEKTYGEAMVFVGERHPINELPYWQDFSISPDGTTLAFIAPQYEAFSDGFYGYYLCLVATDGSRATCDFSRGDDHNESPTWSPNGLSLAYVSGDISFNGATLNIYTTEDGGVGRRRLTNASQYQAYRDPVWSPDGTMLAFQVGQRQDKSTHELFIVSVLGGGEILLVSRENFGPLEVQWSPDNQRLLAQDYRSGEVYLIDVSSPDLTPLEPTEAFVSDPSWSSDGQLLYQLFDSAANVSSIIVAQSDGSNPQRIGVGYVPHWSPDGQTIYYNDSNALIHRIQPDGSGDEIVSQNIMIGTLQAVTADPSQPLVYDTPDCFINGEGARIRNEATTDSDLLGNLSSGEQAVDGQVTDAEGYVWWHLATEGWVRSDLVEESAFCDLQPTINP
jgi:Tol biopolymer transport system component